jgi:hypothetical protein
MNVLQQRLIINRIIAKAWGDEQFRNELRANPKAILQKEGFEGLDNITVEVVENTSTKLHLLIPVKPEGIELQPEDLRLVAAQQADPFNAGNNLLLQ